MIRHHPALAALALLALATVGIHLQASGHDLVGAAERAGHVLTDLPCCGIGQPPPMEAPRHER